jgi:hypothetical protein
MTPILAVIAQAFAASNEVSVELGTLYTDDPSWALFSDTEGLPSKGLRFGYAVHDRVAVVGGWHHVRRGAELTLASGSMSTSSAFLGDEFTLGARGDVAIGDAILPYVALSAMMVRGDVRLDDDFEDDDNPGQVRETDWAPGGLAVGGIELRIPQDEAPFTLAMHLEAGYGATAPLRFGEVGQIQPAGFVMRGGVGVRF